MIEPRTLSGFMELLPEDQIVFNNIKDIIKKNYEKYGFLPLDTPVLESANVLLAKAGGETEKQIYRFVKGESDYCMRFDLTVPLAKYVAKNYNELNFPFARYQIGKVYRGERPQKGRFREFYQCDIDVIGKNELSLSYDALVPSVIYSIFRELNFGKFTIYVSNRKILRGFLASLELLDQSEDILRLIDKVDKIGKENFTLALKEDYKVQVDKVEKIVDFISISGSVDEQLQKLKQLGVENEDFVSGVTELETVTSLMKEFGIEENYFAINLAIARGLDYYTGTVYETFLDEHRNIGSVSSGGRYENLAGFYTKEKLPGVGMSIGLTRLFDQLKTNNLLKSSTSALSKVVILPMGDTVKDCIKISNELRKNDINNVLYLQDGKFKNKLSFATRSGAKYVIIVGEDEVNSQKFTLKNLDEFKQEQLSLQEIVEILKNN